MALDEVLRQLKDSNAVYMITTDNNQSMVSGLLKECPKIRVWFLILTHNNDSQTDVNLLSCSKNKCRVWTFDFHLTTTATQNLIYWQDRECDGYQHFDILGFHKGYIWQIICWQLCQIYFNDNNGQLKKSYHAEKFMYDDSIITIYQIIWVNFYWMQWHQMLIYI